jgi:hypothetical protein
VRIQTSIHHSLEEEFQSSSLFLLPLLERHNLNSQNQAAQPGDLPTRLRNVWPFRVFVHTDLYGAVDYICREAAINREVSAPRKTKSVKSALNLTKRRAAHKHR